MCRRVRCLSLGNYEQFVRVCPEVKRPPKKGRRMSLDWKNVWPDEPATAYGQGMRLSFPCFLRRGFAIAYA